MRSLGKLLKKILIFSLVGLFVVFLGPAVFADAISDYLLGAANVTSDIGGPSVSVFEDVKPIKNIGPRPGSGPVLSNSELAKFASPVKADVGQSLLDKTYPVGLAFAYSSMDDFLKQNFYFDRGGYIFPDDEIEWSSKGTIEKFPFDYKRTKDPHKREFWYCLDKKGFKYIKPTSYAPDSKSCYKHKWMCDYPPCKKAVKEFKDVDGDGINEEVEVEPEDHSGQVENNIYLGLKDYLKKNSILHSYGYQDDKSGLSFKIEVKDRTPPQILGCVGNEFPDLGVSKKATTGDRYEVEGLKIIDNSTGDIGTCLCLGMIYATPGTSWKTSEKWVKEEPIYLKSGSDANYVIMPNTCNGVMRYSVFAWDEANCLNPGEPRIEKDSPQNCYGLSDPPKGYADLGDDPVTAKGFPLKFEGVDKLDPKENRGTGY